jgi:DNA-binding response OmpR family regulator
MAAPVIVVVDDDPDFCQLIQDLLTEEGYQPVICASTDEAPATIRQHRPDLVILDLHVQRRGAGLRLLQQLRQEPATASILVLVVTADTPLLHQHGDWLQAHGVGMLSKPFDLDELLAQVRALLGNQRRRGDERA